MAVAGAILGDIAGSQYEGGECENPWDCDIFTDWAMFTDDTVTTLAVKYAIDNNVPFVKAFKKIGRKYPNCGYAGMFKRWVFSDDEESYGSWGNGSAMRTSYIGDTMRKLKTCSGLRRNAPQ